ncbi:MAG: mycofactocin biosynthesis glycosyltransferase MftF, partial [Deltaproteobacteria bacterium]|nr:mycofactocin biosynthesis glycosyltransferase MftF [Deltaproteobacteria bacterium]
MIDPTVKGSFHLRPGTRLIGRESDGVIIREKPLRAFRVNLPALDILGKCRTGWSPEYLSCPDKRHQIGPILSLLDRLCQAGLMDWEPPKGDFEPFVSIIVPVYNRAQEISACLESLLCLDYPSSKREIIVVDDASEDDTAAVVRRYDVKLVVLESNQGQSAARNVGVSTARGEIIAYIDSDCIAEASWLRDLVPYFQDSRNALVGGYVASFYRETRLDRYEEARSPLNMGENLLVGSSSESDFYVPTCNMLVRKAAYLQVGGLNEGFRVGEDVDLCWRLMERGFRLLYVPKGRVKHKHRNRFLASFRRRFDYGTSEPVLYATHGHAGKRFPFQTASLAVLFTCLAGLLTKQVLFMPAICLILLLDSLLKKSRFSKQMNVAPSFGTVFKATLENHLQFMYHLSHHVVRYYLVLMVMLAVMFKPLVPIVACLV